jgi:hypothetical protein
MSHKIRNSRWLACAAVALIMASAAAVRASPFEEIISDKERIASEKQKVRAFGAKIYADAAAQDKSYQAEVNAINPFEALQPAWLANHPDFAEAHARIRKAHDLLLHHYDQTLQRRSQVVAEIQALGLAADEQQALRSGFEEDVDARQPQNIKIRDSNLALLNEVDVTISFLAAHKRAWTIQKGAIQFSSSVDLQAYRLQMNAIQKSLAESAAMDDQTRAAQATGRAGIANITK